MDVKFYHLSYCPHCHRLKDFLESNNVSFELVDVTENLDLKQEIKNKTGHQTFPQFIIDGEFVGDCSSTIENFEELKEKYNL